jgi:hypothetical protein
MVYDASMVPLSGSSFLGAEGIGLALTAEGLLLPGCQDLGALISDQSKRKRSFQLKLQVIPPLGSRSRDKMGKNLQHHLTDRLEGHNYVHSEPRKYKTYR